MNNGENILEAKVDYHLTSGEKENYYFDGHESLNDLIQVDDNKIVFLYTAILENSYINKLGIIIVNIKKHEEEEYYVHYELYHRLYKF